MATYDREGIARCLFETAMTGHAQWDQMSEPNKDDWRAKADVWISQVTILIEDRARRNTPLSQCGHPDCKVWRSSPCSEGCYWEPPHDATIVEHPSSTLDQMERRVRDLENKLVVVTADLERLGLKYMTLRETLMHAQAAFCERLKDSGIKAEPVRVPPALEM